MFNFFRRRRKQRANNLSLQAKMLNLGREKRLEKSDLTTHHEDWMTRLKKRWKKKAPREEFYNNYASKFRTVNPALFDLIIQTTGQADAYFVDQQRLEKSFDALDRIYSNLGTRSVNKETREFVISSDVRQWIDPVKIDGYQQFEKDFAELNEWRRVLSGLSDNTIANDDVFLGNYQRIAIVVNRMQRFLNSNYPQLNTVESVLYGTKLDFAGGQITGQAQYLSREDKTELNNLEEAAKRNSVFKRSDFELSRMWRGDASRNQFFAQYLDFVRSKLVNTQLSGQSILDPDDEQPVKNIQSLAKWFDVHRGFFPAEWFFSTASHNFDATREENLFQQLNNADAETRQRAWAALIGAEIQQTAAEKANEINQGIDKAADIQRRYSFKDENNLKRFYLTAMQQYIRAFGIVNTAKFSTQVNGEPYYTFGQSANYTWDVLKSQHVEPFCYYHWQDGEYLLDQSAPYGVRLTYPPKFDIKRKVKADDLADALRKMRVDKDDEALFVLHEKQKQFAEQTQATENDLKANTVHDDVFTETPELDANYLEKMVDKLKTQTSNLGQVNTVYRLLNLKPNIWLDKQAMEEAKTTPINFVGTVANPVTLYDKTGEKATWKELNWKVVGKYDPNNPTHTYTLKIYKTVLEEPKNGASPVAKDEALTIEQFNRLLIDNGFNPIDTDRVFNIFGLNGQSDDFYFLNDGTWQKRSGLAPSEEKMRNAFLDVGGNTSSFNNLDQDFTNYTENKTTKLVTNPGVTVAPVELAKIEHLPYEQQYNRLNEKNKFAKAKTVKNEQAENAKTKNAPALAPKPVEHPSDIEMDWDEAKPNLMLNLDSPYSSPVSAEQFALQEASRQMLMDWTKSWDLGDKPVGDAATNVQDAVLTAKEIQETIDALQKSTKALVDELFADGEFTKHLRRTVQSKIVKAVADFGDDLARLLTVKGQSKVAEILATSKFNEYANFSLGEKRLFWALFVRQLLNDGNFSREYLTRVFKMDWETISANIAHFDETLKNNEAIKAALNVSGLENLVTGKYPYPGGANESLDEAVKNAENADLGAEDTAKTEDVDLMSEPMPVVKGAHQTSIQALHEEKIAKEEKAKQKQEKKKVLK